MWINVQKLSNNRICMSLRQHVLRMILPIQIWRPHFYAWHTGELCLRTIWPNSEIKTVNLFYDAQVYVNTRLSTIWSSSNVLVFACIWNPACKKYRPGEINYVYNCVLFFRLQLKCIFFCLFSFLFSLLFLIFFYFLELFFIFFFYCFGAACWYIYIIVTSD